ncbi:adenylate/guanylate cyclase domain-containing protein [Candidatus Gracilibacteria bacterium]|nr:adenylate/guanylate cyclase domain-containing protein [Candidatus Gracilibacteria bacterium]
MLEKLLKNHIFLTFFIGAIVFGIIYVSSIFLVNIDKSLADKMYSSFVTGNVKVSSDIAIVKIDSKTVGKDGLGRFPFSREHYSQLIKNLNNDGAKVIGFDIIFADNTIPEIDENFAKSMSEAGNVIIGGGDLKGAFERPLDIFQESVLSYGFFTPVENKNNKKIYSIIPYKEFSNGQFEHFAVKILKAYFAEKYQDSSILGFFKDERESFFFTSNRSIGYSNPDTKEINLNYAVDSSFYYQSFIDVYKGNFPKGFFKDKIVIIGATADGIKDIFFTPEGIKFGVYTHANFVNTVLTKQYKVYFGKTREYLLLFFLIILSVYFNISRSGKKLLISNISIVSIFFVLIMFITYFRGLVLNFPVQFIFAGVITLTVSNILKSFMEDKNKTKLNKALGQYVSKDIAEEILHGTGKVNLDGERKDISIFFSDIEGFTTISEKMNPEELVQFLREYLGAMSNIIMDQRGLIDKYEGDAIMALWGVFGHEESSTFDNCNAALDQQQKLKILNAGWKEKFGEELKIRMGLHTGEAIVGNIGATGRKMEFTALGDSVNLASRLEEVNKKYGTYLCVSEVVYKEQKENFEFRYLDKIRVKGKTIPIGIYELLCTKGKCSDFKKDIVAGFNSAIELYLQKDFIAAKKIFENLSKLGDTPSDTYIERCDIYIKNKPSQDWDGVWTMESK